MSRTKRQTIGLVLIAALLGFGLVCGLCVGDAQAHEDEVIQDCVLLKEITSRGAGHLYKNRVASAPVALLAPVSPAPAAAGVSLPPYDRIPIYLKTLSIRISLAQLQILLS